MVHPPPSRWLQPKVGRLPVLEILIHKPPFRNTTPESESILVQKPVTTVESESESKSEIRIQIRIHFLEKRIRIRNPNPFWKSARSSLWQIPITLEYQQMVFSVANYVRPILKIGFGGGRRCEDRPRKMWTFFLIFFFKFTLFFSKKNFFDRKKNPKSSHFSGFILKPSRTKVIWVLR